MLVGEIRVEDVVAHLVVRGCGGLRWRGGGQLSPPRTAMGGGELLQALAEDDGAESEPDGGADDTSREAAQ